MQEQILTHDAIAAIMAILKRGNDVQILDDLMDTLRVTALRAYAAVMDKVDKAE